VPEPMTDLDDMRKYSNALRLTAEKRADELSVALTEGSITLEAWTEGMRETIREAHALQFVTGKGGDRSLIDFKEYLQLGSPVARQYRFLAKFVADVEAAIDAGGSLGFVRNRSKMYAKASQAMFWHSAVPVKIPQVPRDGKTRCRTNCKCRLEIKREIDKDGNLVILVWWKLSPAEHCPDCVKLAREWNPLRLVAGVAEASDFESSLYLIENVA